MRGGSARLIGGTGLGASVALFATVVFGGIAAAGSPPPTPTISGEARVGETLTATTAISADRYQWQRCDPASQPCEAPPSATIARAPGAEEGWLDIDGATASQYTIPARDLGYLLRVQAKNTSLGTQWAASEATDPVVDPAPPPEPPPPEPPPPEPNRTRDPVFQSTGNLDPIEGRVLVQVPGADQPVSIDELTQIPIGSKVDVSNGRVLLTTQVRPEGELQTVELWAGAFRFQQRRKRAITQFALTAPLGDLPSARRSASRGETRPAGRRRGGRRLWGRGRCRCRTRGRRSSGTVRGTHWLTAERRAGTYTRVKAGRVVVRDFRLNEKIVLKAGEHYLARRR